MSLDPTTAATLRHHREWADANAGRCEVALHEDALVFSHAVDGSKLWLPDHSSHAFRALCRRAGVTGIRLHDLRHYVAARLLAMGVESGDTRDGMTDMELHLRVAGSGPPVLFIHGLGGSGAYWGDTFDRLAESYRLAFVDLAGFGRSMAVAGPYDIAGHLERLVEVRERHLPGNDLVVVGHSFGALLAVAASATWPDVAGVLALGLPAFRSAAEARVHLQHLGTMERWIAKGAWQARAACWMVCRARPLARLVAPLLAGDVPRAVARAGADHTWPAYDASFRSLVEDADVRGWIASRGLPRTVLQGSRDRVCPPELLREALDGLAVDLRVLDGDHHLALHQPQQCLEALEAMLQQTAGR